MLASENIVITDSPLAGEPIRLETGYIGCQLLRIQISLHSLENLLDWKPTLVTGTATTGVSLSTRWRTY